MKVVIIDFLLYFLSTRIDTNITKYVPLHELGEDVQLTIKFVYLTFKSSFSPAVPADLPVILLFIIILFTLMNIISLMHFLVNKIYNNY